LTTTTIGKEAQMNEVVALLLVLLLATSGYAAGRLHAQFSYRLGFRFGYRQGYYDGDRSSWTRRRREMQAALASVLTTPADELTKPSANSAPVGTMYASDASLDEPDDEPEPTAPVGPRIPGRHARGPIMAGPARA
jgi:hypothetical protein